jgi:hypothetical protein
MTDEQEDAKDLAADIEADAAAQEAADALADAYRSGYAAGLDVFKGHAAQLFAFADRVKAQAMPQGQIAAELLAIIKTIPK